MNESTLVPFLERGAIDRSVIVGAPEDFDFQSILEKATAVRIAIAFGHMSGWEEIEEHLKRSSAATIQVLLGQAFFQTEPQLLLRIKSLQESRSPRPLFEAKLASHIATFHPKLWIIDNDTTPVSIVGSGNLSRGGLLRNVECGMFTSRSADVDALRDWFDRLWAATHPLTRTYQDYITKYQVINAARKLVNAQIEAASRELADKDATWRRRKAITKAAEYWRSEEGKMEVEGREAAISRMRSLLDYPSFEFGVDQWREFLRIPELGRIRLGHEKRMIAELPKLKGILQKIAAPSTAVGKSLDMLQAIPGIGRNLATKLLAMHQPERFVVVNEPVESALRAFGYDVEMSTGVTGTNYGRFLKDLSVFIDECENVGLRAAPALDAFFYAYRDAPEMIE
jgi:HKD family nuclease